MNGGGSSPELMCRKQIQLGIDTSPAPYPVCGSNQWFTQSLFGKVLHKSYNPYPSCLLDSIRMWITDSYSLRCQDHILNVFIKLITNNEKKFPSEYL